MDKILLAGALDDGFNAVNNFRATAGFRDFGNDPTNLVFTILGYALGFLALFALIVIIYAGFKYLTSVGDEKKADEAKKILLYALIGLFIIGTSGLIVNVMLRLFFTPR